MELYGTLLMRFRNYNSKSEGWYAYLLTNDLQLYQLYRPGNFPVNDSFFMNLTGRMWPLPVKYRMMRNIFL